MVVPEETSGPLRPRGVRESGGSPGTPRLPGRVGLFIRMAVYHPAEGHRSGSIPAGRPPVRERFVSLAVGVLAITLILFFVVALTARLILGR